MKFGIKFCHLKYYLRINLCVTHIIWQSLNLVEGVTFNSWKDFDIQIVPICLCFLCRV